MSFENATAIDHFDLLARIRTFVESTILPAGERWVVERYTGSQEYLASSELVGNEKFLGFEDISPNERWLTAVGQATPSYLGCDFVTPIDVRRVTIQGVWTTAGGDNTMNPANFDLEYSDNGTVWSLLESFATGGFGNGILKSFNVNEPSPGARRYWRIRITANTGGNTDHSAVQYLRFETDEGSGWLNHAEEPQLIVRGPGLAAQDAIYVGLQIYSRPTSDIYNIRLAGFTGFVASNTFATQPGNFGTPVGFPIWNLGTEYWLAANGQRIALVCKVETVYMTCYLGKVLPYATPGQWSYPIMVSGMLPADTLTRYSDTAIIGPWDNASPRMRLRLPGGTWIEPDVFPWLSTSNMRNVPGGYAVIPAELTDADGIYGVMDGVAQVSGFEQVVENLIDIGGTDHLVVHDVYRTGIRSYHTLRLD